MQVLDSTLLLLLAVALSVVVSSIVRVPLTLLQIVIGLLMAPLLRASEITDPALFMTLFVAPLLFVDAFLASRQELLSVRGPIALMAFGLVGFTVAAAGFFIHKLVPAIPTAIGFALAAALSPTDAVALTGSLRNVRAPHHLLRVLEGEALLNDATGLVCFRFAVLAAVTGTFSWTDAASSLIQTALGGVLIGSCLAWAMARGEIWIQRRTGPQPASQVLLGLLLPFASYTFAERMHCSGILSAVSSGFVLSLLVGDLMAPATRTHGIAVIEMLRMTFNGFIFVFLGARLPYIANAFRTDTSLSFMGLCMDVLCLTLFLMATRFTWVTVVLGRSQRNAQASSRMKDAAFFSVAGVRGALTLASILSIPVLSASGTPLPGRTHAIVVATGVILASLVIAPLALPLLETSLDLEVSGSNA